METRYTKEWYAANMDKHVRAGRFKCRVSNHRTESRQGSYERGLRWSVSQWATLVRLSDCYVSMDHGKTWHFNASEAYRKTKGKLRLESSNHGEFAFDAIQRLNRSWDPSFRWHP